MADGFTISWNKIAGTDRYILTLRFLSFSTFYLNLIHQNTTNAKVWVQVQFKLCEKFHVILWKQILSRSWSHSHWRSLWINRRWQGYACISIRKSYFTSTDYWGDLRTVIVSVVLIPTTWRRAWPVFSYFFKIRHLPPIGFSVSTGVNSVTSPS